MPEEPAGDGVSKVSGFLPAEFFGDKPPKSGDTCTITVKSVDPESGEAEVTYSDETPDENQGAMAALDEQFPEETEE